MWAKLLADTEHYLENALIPFWATRAPEPEFGGFNTNYDRNGEFTGVDDKTMLGQARVIFACAHAVRLGHRWDGWRESLVRGLAFLDRHLKDPVDGGYFWIVDKDGTLKDDRKVIYGHAFLIYAFAEFALLTGDKAAADRASELFDLLCSRAADLHNGGFFEHFTRDFRLDIMRPDGVAHKSLDVHMHLMEALTALYELTGRERHRNALVAITDLIFERMVDAETGTGISMFMPDWTPIPNVQLGTLWGKDRFDPAGKPIEITSYGHNIELAWLYLHSLDVLGIPREEGMARAMPIFEHTMDRGVDRVKGGLFVEGWRHGEVTERSKEFWQQAEALVGFLDAFALTGDQAYADAFRCVYDFVFGKMVSPEQGEWYALLDEDGTVLWDYMGYNWKTCYHTVRAMCEVVKRLRPLAR